MASGPLSGNNVIDLGQAVRPESGLRVSPARVIAMLKVTASKRIGALVGTLFERVDDALFDMAERAANNANQARFFDGMREIRKKRQQCESQFLDGMGRRFSEFEAGKLAPTAEESSSTDSSRSHEPLALVEETELEESLAVVAMVDKAESRLNRSLFALCQRLAVLVGGKKVDPANAPNGPKLLAQAFANAVREFDVDLQVKLIVLKLFERHVLTELEPVYDEANALLVQAGVLPQLKYSAPQGRRGDSPAPRPSPSAAPGAASTPNEAEALPDAPVYSHSDTEIVSLVGELRSLLASRRPAASPSSGNYASSAFGTGPASSRAPSANELLNALSLMQSELQSQWPQHAPGEYAPAPSAANQVKEELLSQIQKLSGNNARPQHLGADEDTIDLVGMLFEYALQDRNLPSPMQALLGRLQIPYLKMALLDRDFVAQKSHPARRLLDDLAQSSVGWSAESDKDNRLYNKVHEIVTTLLKDFDDDISIFDKLNSEFNDFVDKNRKRAELVERRTAEAARGREKLETAQRIAARAILTRVGGRSLPGNVRDLLTRRWSNYMVLTYLRHGDESTEWRTAERFIDDFAWSVQPMADEADRLKLRDMMPEVERVLRQGLASTGMHESQLNDLWKEIEDIYEQQIMSGVEDEEIVLGEVSDHDGSGHEADADGLTIRFASTKAGEEVVFSHDTEVNEAAANASLAETLDTWLKIARALKTGTWFEFVKDDGSRERAKLLWVSTIRALYLFVNRNGLKIAEKTANELAEELKNQRAVILEQVALVDRALDAILRRLRGAPTSEAQAAAEAEAAERALLPSNSPVGGVGFAASNEPLRR